jgi:cytochrome c-type biogenesis protein CcmH/NrfG
MVIRLSNSFLMHSRSCCVRHPVRKTALRRLPLRTRNSPRTWCDPRIGTRGSNFCGLCSRPIPPIQKCPTSQGSLVALGEIYLDQERFDDAIVQLERARTIDPKEKSACSHLAVAYRRAGKPEEARRILNMLKDLHQAERGWVTEKMKTADDNPADSSSATHR